MRYSLLDVFAGGVDSSAAGAGGEEEEGGGEEDQNAGKGELAGEVGTSEENVCEAGDGDEGRERVEPEAEGAGEVGLGAAQVENADVLDEELKQDADDDEGRDDLSEREKAAEHGDGGEGEERGGGQASGGMETGERRKEGACASSSEGDTGVAEQEREDAGEGSEHDEQGGGLTETGSELRADEGCPGGEGEEADDGAAGVGVDGRDQLLPGQDGEDGNRESEVHGGAEQDGAEDSAGNGAAGVADLGAEKGDVVVAPVVVGGNEHRGGEAGEEGGRESEGVGRESERSAEVRGGAEEGGGDDEGDGAEDDGRQQESDALDAGDAAIEEGNGEEDGEDGDGGGGAGGDGDRERAEVGGVQCAGAGERGGEPAGVVAQADGSGGDRERGGEQELYEEEEGEIAAERAGEDATEEVEGAARGGKGRAELGPDQAIAQGEERAKNPAQHGLRAAHTGEKQRKGDEGANADHVEQVEGDGAAQGEGALELGRGGDGESVEGVVVRALRAGSWVRACERLMAYDECVWMGPGGCDDASEKRVLRCAQDDKSGRYDKQAEMERGLVWGGPAWDVGGGGRAGRVSRRGG